MKVIKRKNRAYEEIEFTAVDIFNFIVEHLKDMQFTVWNLRSSLRKTYDLYHHCLDYNGKEVKIPLRILFKDNKKTNKKRRYNDYSGTQVCNDLIDMGILVISNKTRTGYKIYKLNERYNKHIK